MMVQCCFIPVLQNSIEEITLNSVINWKLVFAKIEIDQYEMLEVNLGRLINLNLNS